MREEWGASDRGESGGLVRVTGIILIVVPLSSPLPHMLALPPFSGEAPWAKTFAGYLLSLYQMVWAGPGNLYPHLQV